MAKSNNSSSKVYDHLNRRSLTVNDGNSHSLRVNSRSLNSVIDQDHLPKEHEYIPAPPPKPGKPWNPGRFVERPGNADKVVVQNARRNQMRPKERMVTRFQPSKDEKQNVEVCGPSMCGSRPPWED